MWCEYKAISVLSYGNTYWNTVEFAPYSAQQDMINSSDLYGNDLYPAVEYSPLTGAACTYLRAEIGPHNKSVCCFETWGFKNTFFSGEKVFAVGSSASEHGISMATIALNLKAWVDRVFPLLVFALKISLEFCRILVSNACFKKRQKQMNWRCRASCKGREDMLLQSSS